MSSEFLPQHVKYFTDRASTEAEMRALGIVSIGDQQADQDRIPEGWANWTRWPAFFSPWTNPAGVSGWQVHPDEPGTDKNGKPVKFKTLPGSAPGLWAARVVPGSKRSMVLEGVGKLAAALRYAPADVSLYAVAGVRMWQRDGGVALGDVAALEDQEVVIAFDGDARINRDVFDAGMAFRSTLEAIGATKVAFLRLPGSSGTTGVDDYLQGLPEAKRADVLGRLIMTAKPKPADARPKAKVQKPTGATVLPGPDDPMAVARVIEPELKAGQAYTLRNWRGGWWRWQTSHWAEIEDLALRGDLYGRTEHAVFVTEEGSYEKWRPTRTKIANLTDALASIVHLDRETKTPAWLAGDRTDLGTIVSCRNGLLRLEGRELLAHDAAYFNLVAVPFDFEADAEEPKEWLKFLDTVWPDGGEGQVAALQEWFGYVLSGRTDFQKIFAIIGPPRSGKGTIASVLTELVGALNVAGPTLASLATNFGMQPMLGKSLALISDARIGRSVDTSVVVERLLTISGEDVLTVDRKNREHWEGRIPARIMLLSNELPRFSDGSGTIATRFVVTETVQSFLGREDRGLKARLMAELPGILNWALDGLERLLARGHFTDTEVSTEAVDVMRQTASPFAPFVEDECLVGPEYEVAPEVVWQAWGLWCFQNGRERTGTVQWLGRDLKSVVPGLRIARPKGDDGKQHRVYRGLGLKSDYPSETHIDADIPIARVAETTTSIESKEGVSVDKGRNRDIRVSARLSLQCPYHAPDDRRDYCPSC